LALIARAFVGSRFRSTIGLLAHGHAAATQPPHRRRFRYCGQPA
jgi:hypothetical protein